MISYKAEDFEAWDRFYRANVINSITGYKSVSLIGSANSMRQTNLGLFSSIVHIGSNPALVGYINRPRKAAPHTLANIESMGYYTINHIQPMFLEKAHQTSAKYPAGVSEFEEVGLSTEYIDDFPAPFVIESKVKYALALQEIVPIKMNDTFLVIGKVQSIHLADDLLLPDGFIDLYKAETVCSNGIDSYYSTMPIARFAYAKPNSNVKKIIGNG